MQNLQITIRPVGRGLFAAELDGRELVRSREPLLASARVLLAEGVDPGARLAMRHAGADYDAMAATVGAAARLTVADGSDGRPRFRPWRAPPFGTVAPPVHFSGDPLSDIGVGPDASTGQEGP